MLNISPFGMFHTIIALAAVTCGLAALIKYGEIGMHTRAGRLYVWLTAATAFTGLFIFRHGGFGPPHALAILTLVVLLIAHAAGKRGGTGLSRYLAVTGYSLTLFFHLIPGLTETGTRIPLGAPAFSGPEDPTLKLLVGIGFAIYLAGAAWQVLRIRRALRNAAPV